MDEINSGKKGAPLLRQARGHHTHGKAGEGHRSRSGSLVVLLGIVRRRLPEVTEQVGTERPRLPLPAFWQQVVIRPLRNRTGRHSEEASHVSVFAAEGFPYCAFSHVHGRSVVR
ncbi:hypothetical protein [Stenotrophomonas tuberculopleuritidis]|uniref:hypothetical protein n=1 Tax=Stenotrophomonas tuberculopleuritidis TaxID=3055079 RepID=UPI0026E57B21|nr:hypothetical protein [Stenotrophomonas sp. 704A1]